GFHLPQRRETFTERFFECFQLQGEVGCSFRLKRVLDPLVQDQTLIKMDDVPFIASAELSFLFVRDDLLRLPGNLVQFRFDLIKRNKSEAALQRIEESPQLHMLKAKDL